MILKNVSKRMLSLCIAFIMVFSLLPVTPIEVIAATGLDTVGVSGLGVSCKEDNGNVEGSTGAVTLSATTEIGSCSSSVGEVSVTFTNNSDAEAVLSFQISKPGQGTVTYSDGTTYKDGQYSTTLQSGASLKVTFKGSGETSGTVYCYITSISLASKTASYDVTVNYDNAMGSVQVNGTAVNSGHTVEDVTATAPITLKAIPATGAEFFGWMIQDTNDMVSQSAEYTCTPGQDMILKAVFIKADGSSAPWFAVGVASGQKTIITGTYKTTVAGITISTSNVEQTVRTVGINRYFNSLNEAAEYAKNSSTGKVIVLMSDGTLPAGNYEIPAGVKLLIPYDSANTYGEADPISMNAPESGNSRTHSPQAFRTLTLADGVTLNVSGNIELSALHYASHGGKTYGGTPYQYYGYMKMEGSSKIVLNSGAKLYAWGYITGSSAAQVIANPGAAVYEKMQVADYRGGNATTDLTKDGHFPFSQYYVQNVEVKTTIYSGANLVCHATIFASSVQENPLSFMGSDAMFRLGAGAKATKYYDAKTDRLIVDVEGDFSINSISVMGYNTKDFVLPLQQNMTVNINSGTDATIDQDIMLQPGCVINVAEGATLTLASGKKAYLMDASDWGTYCFSAKLQPITYVPTKGATPGIRTANNMTEAQVNVNGTLIVNGAIFASTNHASVVSTGKSGVIEFKSDVIENTSIKQCTSNDESGFVDVQMYPVVLTNPDGTTTVDVKGATADTTFTCCQHGWHSNTCQNCCPHYYDNGCDKECNACGNKRETNHIPGEEATCTTAQICTECKIILEADRKSVV